MTKRQKEGKIEKGTNQYVWTIPERVDKLLTEGFIEMYDHMYDSLRYSLYTSYDNSKYLFDQFEKLPMYKRMYEYYLKGHIKKLNVKYWDFRQRLAEKIAGDRWPDDYY